MLKKLKYIPYHFNATALACVVVMAGVFVSCEKDEEIASPVEPPIIDEPCTPIPPWNGLGFRPSIDDTNSFSQPLVNPNNPDEIIFLKNSNRKLYKLNYITGEKNVVLENAMGYIWPDWGVNDWLLFSRMQNLYKVKTNGDSLTQITFNGVGWRASWNPDGTKYLYTTILPSGDAATVIANNQDVIIDTLPVGLNIDTDWVTDDTIFFNASMYVLGQPSVTEFMSVSPSGWQVAALNSSEFMILAAGLRRVNAVSGIVEIVHPGYPTCNTYFGLDYSPQKQKLLSYRFYRELMADGVHEYIRLDVVWLNLDGTVHEVIDIAQFMNDE